MGQTSNNFTIIKSITIIFVYVSWLKKNLSYFSLLTHTHTLIISFKGSNTLLSPPRLSSRRRQPFALPSLAIFIKAAIPCTLLPLVFLPSKNPFSLSWFHAYFPSPHREDFWAKAKAKAIAIKFFIALSIYKTLLLFPLRLGIHYLFNKE